MKDLAEVEGFKSIGSKILGQGDNLRAQDLP